MVRSQPMNPLLVVLCTFPDAATARHVATILIERQLAACVNLLPGLESIYRWQGNTETAAEVLAIIKTTQPAYEAMAATLTTLHPYEVPEILALPVAHGSMAYLNWVVSSVQPAQAGPGTPPPGD